MATPTGQFTHGDYLLGIEGLAILRASFAGDFASIETRREELQRILEHGGEEPYNTRRDLPPGGIQEGYAIWSKSYDPPSEDHYDPIIQNEGPAVRALMDELPEGRILDAACGTGRHTTHLAELGREVVGTEIVPAMLDKAKAKLPSVEFHEADLADLPFEDASFDGAVCGLAFLHLPDINPATRELARVLKPGAPLIISVPHPFVYNVLGWRAPVFDDDGTGMVMPEYGHLHSTYLEAFAAAGLTVRRCIEPILSDEQARWNPAGGATAEDPALEQALSGQPAVLIWQVERTAGRRPQAA
jgi:ubiquinone/menaquinone biosynthesis C-methylase UbiE